MNDIYTKQNEEYILMLQYSQRKHYDMAENIQYCIWSFMILNIIINNNVIIGNLLGSNIVKVIGSVLTVLYILLKLEINKNIEIGAYTKEFIDCTLFDFDIKKNLKKFTKEQLSEFAVCKKKKNSSDYLCQINNTGKDEPRGVKNWYENREQMDMKNAVYGCQKENIWWDQRLSKIYMYIFIVISVLVIVSILFINRNESVKSLIFAVLIPSVQILIESITQVVNFIKLMIYRAKVDIMCKSIEKDLNNIRIDDLQELQELILQRRTYKFIIPNKLHSILSRKFHELREAMEQVNFIKP